MLCAKPPRGHPDGLLPGRPRLSYCLFNEVCGVDHVLVLPEPKNRPPQLQQMTIGVPVALDIPTEFGLPPIGIVLRSDPVLRATVPEASIHEDGDSRRAEEEICASSRHIWQRRIDSVTEPAAVQLSAQREFRLRVSSGLT